MLKRVFSPRSTGPVLSPVLVSTTTESPGLLLPHLQSDPYAARFASKADAPPPPQSSGPKLPGEGEAPFLPGGACLIVYQHFLQNFLVGSQLAVAGLSSSSKGTRPPGQFAENSGGKVFPGSGAIAAMGAGQNLTFPGTDIPAVAFASRFVVPSMVNAKNDLTGTGGVATLMNRSLSFSESVRV